MLGHLPIRGVTLHPVLVFKELEMTPLNLPLMQVQYEVLHESIADIALTHNVSESMVEYAIRTHKWERKRLTPTQQSTELETVTSDRQAALEAIHTLRQGVLDPQYIKIEAALVAKAIDIVNGIQATEATASKRLKEVTDILATLRPTKNMVKDTQANNSLKLMIMNHVGDINKAQTKHEEIEVVVNATG